MATGLEDFRSILDKLPTKYHALKNKYERMAVEITRQNKRASLGRLTENLFLEILCDEEKLPVSVSEAMYEDRSYGKQVKPDLSVGNKIAYIEIKKWDDSNEVRSAIFEGYLIKKKLPDSKFYILVGGGIWSGSKTTNFLKQHTKIGTIEAVDGWFDASTIEQLANRLRNDIHPDNF
jgi:hypothetical protein